MRAVTFNLWNRPWRRRRRLRAAARLLGELDADLVALQEVATGWWLPGDPLDVIAGLPHRARAWHETNLGAFKTGLALLSREPIDFWRYREFTRFPFWDAKGFLDARVGELRVLVVHLASTRDDGTRRSELAELEAAVREECGPTLILGDFNTSPDHPALVDFAARSGLERFTPEIPTWLPGNEVLDYAFARGLRVREGRVIVPPDPKPSDHLPVAVDLTP